VTAATFSWNKPLDRLRVAKSNAIVMATLKIDQPIIFSVGVRIGFFLIRKEIPAPMNSIIQGITRAGSRESLTPGGGAYCAKTGVYASQPLSTNKRRNLLM
jgi:hypothetical protein